ncbi:MAG: pro-sigmaK processing inhibitor BofA family protein [Oscillospiraceae bacterium]|jgi:pro-sigmaK processing inhibitor BofA|nr:pro-sigmaK processing inhibitor BofA family protein [Oscillospiraceae bacterium]
MKILAIVLLGAAAAFVLWSMVKTRRPLIALLLTALSGTAALFAVNLLGTVLPISLPINWTTLGTGVLMGVPGIIGMLVLQIAF